MVYDRRILDRQVGRNAQLFAEARENERLEHEMNLAGKIQQSLLPQTPPETPGIEVGGRLIPAREVGGPATRTPCTPTSSCNGAVSTAGCRSTTTLNWKMSI